MLLDDLPLVFILVGLALYTVLGGADFGVGIWQLTAGRGPAAERLREHAHDSMAPVWEANHVWLIFALTVMWTAYPTVFGSIASTLCVPLFIAAIGIMLRGAAYAVRSGTTARRERGRVDTVFAISSILTPFALGTVVGGVASRRVPVGNAAGDLVTGWLNPISILIGVLAVASAGYLAAVFLAADAMRIADADLARRFRVRALLAGCAAGVAAGAGLVVLRVDAPALARGLLDGAGRPALLVSVVAGVLAVALVWRRRFGLARYTAALAVASLIAGWAAAQQPVLLPGLTVEQAAAPRDTLLLVVAAVLIGAVLLFPSLALLFSLVLRGRFDPTSTTLAAPPPPARTLITASAAGLLARSAAACLIAGIGLLTVAEAGWAHAVGAVCLLGVVVLGFLAVAPVETAAADAGTPERPA